MSTGCSEKSKYKNNPMYECGPNGKYVLKKGYKKQNISGAPKRPLTAYFLWAQDVRPTYKNQNHNLKVTEIAKLMGADWKTLPQSTKQPYIEAAEKAKKQYGQKAEQFKQSHQGKLTQVVEKVSAKKGVKKGPSGYNLFSKKVFADLKSSGQKVPLGEASKQISAAWKQLSDNEKEKWNQQAKAYKPAQYY